jgi:hypothetical protein
LIVTNGQTLFLGILASNKHCLLKNGTMQLKLLLDFNLKVYLPSKLISGSIRDMEWDIMDCPLATTATSTLNTTVTSLGRGT